MTRKISAGVISLIGVLALGAPSFAQSGSGGSGGAHSSGSSGGGTQQGQREMFEQQRSDKTQQGQQLINEQPMQQHSDVQGRKQTQMQQADMSNTGADLTGGRDSHLGPQESGTSGSSQGTQMKQGKGQERGDEQTHMQNMGTKGGGGH